MAKKEEKAVKEKSKENKVKKHFFKDFKAELKKVTWPTPKQLINNTVAVVVIVVIVAAIVFALDAVFEAMNKYGISNLQNYVVEKFGEDEEENKDDSSEQENEGTEEQSENNNTEGDSSSETNETSEGDSTADNQDSADSNQ